MNFELENNTLRVINVNPRREKHGDDNVPAVDIKLRLESANDSLTMYSGHLKSALYHKSAASSVDPQGQLDGVDPVSDLPNLRFPQVVDLKWNAELSGYTLSIDHGLGGKSNLVLHHCCVNNFALQCKEGGTVVHTFRVQCDEVSEKELGRLCTLIDSDIVATLTGPENTEM